MSWASGSTAAAATQSERTTGHIRWASAGLSPCRRGCCRHISAITGSRSGPAIHNSGRRVSSGASTAAASSNGRLACVSARTSGPP
jgi:hypothetical protein